MKGATVGLTAGLIGGSLAGLMIGIPGLSSAASSDSAAVAVVAQVDPTDDTSTDEATEATERPDKSVQLREMLQALVDDGTITADQADAVTAHMIESRSEGVGGGRGHGGPGKFGGRDGARSEALAEVLGIDAETLREELSSGSTIADLAAANGVSVDDVVAALTAEAQTRIDEAVAEGKITQEEADAKLAEIETKISERVNAD